MDRIPDNWYKDFFHGITTETWSRMVPEPFTQEEVAFLKSALGLKPGMRLLDVPCGNGRHLLTLAREGYEVLGVDISAEYMAALQLTIQEEGLPATVLLGDLLETDVPGEFQGGWCLGNSFGYFAPAGMQVFLDKVGAGLAPGGRFVINSGMVAESILPNFSAHEAFEVGDLTMVVDNDYDLAESCMHCQLEFRRAGQPPERRAFKHYVYTLGELGRMFRAAGLRLSAMYGDLEGTPYVVGDQQVYVVVERG